MAMKLARKVREPLFSGQVEHRLGIDGRSRQQFSQKMCLPACKAAMPNSVPGYKISWLWYTSHPHADPLLTLDSSSGNALDQCALHKEVEG